MSPAPNATFPICHQLSNAEQAGVSDKEQSILPSPDFDNNLNNQEASSEPVRQFARDQSEEDVIRLSESPSSLPAHLLTHNQVIGLEHTILSTLPPLVGALTMPYIVYEHGMSAATDAMMEFIETEWQCVS